MREWSLTNWNANMDSAVCLMVFVLCLVALRLICAPIFLPWAFLALV